MNSLLKSYLCRVKRLLLATPVHTSQKSILFRRYIDSVESKIQLLTVCVWNMCVRKVLCVITWGSSLSCNLTSVFWSAIERLCVCMVVVTTQLTHAVCVIRRLSGPKLLKPGGWSLHRCDFFSDRWKVYITLNEDNITCFLHLNS